MSETTPEIMLETALTLRRAGVLIFEIRCWRDHVGLSAYDGKMWRGINGCGSYYRFPLGTQPQCPFCGMLFDMSNRFPYTDPNLWPPTLNYTGKRHEYTEDELALLNKYCGGAEVEGELEKEMSP